MLNIKWIPCVPHESINPELKYKIVLCEEPDYWCHIPFEKLPGNFTGRMYAKTEDDNELLTFDEMEQLHPEAHEYYVKNLVVKINEQAEEKKCLKKK